MEQSNLTFVETFGYRVFSDDLGKIPLTRNGAKTINTISPNSYGIATKDTVFREALIKTDYLVLDGVYFALGSMVEHGKNIRRNQGPDVFNHFMTHMNETGGTVFFMGSSEKTLALMQKKASECFPNVKTFTYSPPFREKFSPSENEEILEAINIVKPDIVFVGMTCPKQEKWAVENKHLIDSSLIISIGNVFDWFAGTQKAIHPFWFKMRLGWLVRIFLRPEIFRRNIGNQMIFFGDLIKTIFTGSNPQKTTISRKTKDLVNTR